MAAASRGRLTSVARASEGLCRSLSSSLSSGPGCHFHVHAGHPAFCRTLSSVDHSIRIRQLW